MFDADAFAEVWATISRHKLRTALTAFSVAWGVFMLIILLGAGKGLENGASDGFKGDALNAIWVNTGTTALPFAGHNPGRKIKLDNSDLISVLGIRQNGLEHISGEYQLPGTFPVRNGNRRSTFNVHGAFPEHRFIENQTLREGRVLNEGDLIERRKVAFIGPLVAEVLFGKESPIGQYIQIRGSNFLVVGVYEDVFGNEDDQRQIFIPLTTAQLLSSSTSDLTSMGVTVANSNLEVGQALVKTMREMFADHHRYSKEDTRAVRLFNNLELNSKISRMFIWIRAFIWLVGIGTLLAGIVGVSNIMLISVKERTQEIGIRKAIGATPASIVRMIVAESLLITAFAGYIGLAAGIGAISLANRFLPPMKGMRDPSVNFEVALGATVLIVIAGTLAGLFPARKAAATHPITALRNE
jgi:putative ABC transport system permease protein